MELNDALEQFEQQEKLHTNEGRRGVENLCRIVHAMGYRDSQHFGQIHPQGSYGDLINFLEDNSGCVEAIKECSQLGTVLQARFKGYYRAHAVAMPAQRQKAVVH